MKSSGNTGKICILGIVLLSTLLIWSAVVSTSPSDTLVVAFLDVGQGDAIFIEAPNGSQVLIDGGPNKSVLRELGRMMPFYDRSIDVVIATHPDSDHIGGLPAVFKNFDVDVVFDPGVDSDSGVFKAYEDLILEKNIKRIHPFAGTVISLGKDISLEILFPDRDASNMKANTASIIARLVYGESEFLFTGDSPKSIEKYLMSIGADIESDVLKVGHHGSKTSSVESFVARVSPAIAVVSAGKDNRYGHPHREVIETFNAAEIDMYSTAEEGTIICTTKGDGVVKCK